MLLSSSLHGYTGRQCIFTPEENVWPSTFHNFDIKAASGSGQTWSDTKVQAQSWFWCISAAGITFNYCNGDQLYAVSAPV